MREGCVRETLGAVIAVHRARRAKDAEVARAMKSIAEDELRAAVQRAIAREVAALETELAEPPRDVAEIAGAPDIATFHALFQRVTAEVWSPALAEDVTRASG